MIGLLAGGVLLQVAGWLAARPPCSRPVAWRSHWGPSGSSGSSRRCCGPNVGGLSPSRPSTCSRRSHGSSWGPSGSRSRCSTARRAPTATGRCPHGVRRRLARAGAAGRSVVPPADGTAGTPTDRRRWLSVFELAADPGGAAERRARAARRDGRRMGRVRARPGGWRGARVRVGVGSRSRRRGCSRRPTGPRPPNGRAPVGGEVTSGWPVTSRIPSRPSGRARGARSRPGSGARHRRDRRAGSSSSESRYRTREDRAGVAAPHRDDGVGRLDDLVGPRFRELRADVECPPRPCVDRRGITFVGRASNRGEPRPCRRRSAGAIRPPSGTARVVHAEEDDQRDVRGDLALDASERAQALTREPFDEQRHESDGLRGREGIDRLDHEPLRSSRRRRCPRTPRSGASTWP